MSIMLHDISADREPQTEQGDRERADTFDLSMLLEEWSEKPHVVTKLVDCFIRQTQEDINAMVTASGVSDPVRLAAIAHSLKGAAGTLGVESIRVEAARLEERARKYQWTDALASVEILRRQFDDFCKYASELSLPPIP
jgi:HPt (histidine-containing phosphotransfer) domain-containing protein